MYSRSLAQDLAFGAPFDPTAQDATRARAIASGVLELSPHRPWRLPSVPTWRENPYKEPNWVAQFHMLRWLDPLRRQAERGQHEHLDTWLRLAESWISCNPPGRGRANYSWADMVEAARAMTFCFALPIIEQLEPDRLPVIINSIREHGEWLSDESHIRRGNHALQQHQGLLVIGAVLQSDEWVRLAVERARRMLVTAYDDEGVNEEGTPQYHQINYTWWRNLGRRVEMVTGSLPPEFTRISLAPEAMAHATRPDGRYELIGDTEEFSPRGLGHPAIDYVSSGGAQGESPADRVAVYKAGFIFGRSSWGDSREPFSDSSFYSLRFGAQDRIHGHADGMSLTLFANGRPLLVDSGKYAYDATDAIRAHLLSREAHNSLSVRGVKYDISADVELISYHVGSGAESFSFEDRGYEGVELRRRVAISARHGIAVVVDTFSSCEPVTVDQWWHLNPDMSHRREQCSVYAQDPKAAIRLSWVPGQLDITVVKGRKNPMQGWFSPVWRTVVPTRAIGASMSGRRGVLATAISFRDALNPVTISAASSSPGVYRVRRGQSQFVADTEFGTLEQRS